MWRIPGSRGRCRWIGTSLLATGVLFGAGCQEKRPLAAAPASSASEPPPRRDALVGGPLPTLLVVQAQFQRKPNSLGKLEAVPGYAKIVLVRRTQRGWEPVTIEDPDSKVFHRVVPYDLDGKGMGFLTLGGTQASLKFWRFADGAWTQQTLWNPKFGGQWDRLRDLEIGDVTGDDRPEMVVATHDQGVVAVLQRDGERWRVREMDRQPRVFVHEIEIGDVDGDGRNEFFATPSSPNQATLVSQPGQIVMYKYDGSAFTRTVVDAPEGTHAKEILVLDAAGTGWPTLFAAVEARTEMRDGRLERLAPVQIKEYRFAPDGITSRVVATLDDRQCRFLSPGDVDGDGRTEIVATGMESGVWLLRRQEDGTWTPSVIDRDSSGFEHAALVADLEGDGRPEVYVASDRQKELRRYVWRGDRFEKEVLLALSGDEITFNLAAGRF